MNRYDIRRMLSRESMVSSHGLDTNEWPALSAMPAPPKRRTPAPAFPAATHRGLGAIPTEPRRDDQELVVLDWGLGREAVTPPPRPRPRARTSSPPGRARFGDLAGAIKAQPLMALLRDPPQGARVGNEEGDGDDDGSRSSGKADDETENEEAKSKEQKEGVTGLSRASIRPSGKKSPDEIHQVFNPQHTQATTTTGGLRHGYAERGSTSKSLGAQHEQPLPAPAPAHVGTVKEIDLQEALGHLTGAYYLAERAPLYTEADRSNIRGRPVESKPISSPLTSQKQQMTFREELDEQQMHIVFLESRQNTFDENLDVAFGDIQSISDALSQAGASQKADREHTLKTNSTRMRLLSRP